jgi:hypothetical protein
MGLESVDMAVATTAMSTAKGMNANSTVILALFEAALVESGCRNLDYGDRDSLGFLQQRPSMGWPNPRDVPTATRSFVSRAIKNNAAHPDWSAGKLAQSVQISAFPSRYDARATDARALIAKVGSPDSGTPDSGTPDSGTPASGTPVTTTPVGLTDSFDWVSDVGTWKRVSVGVLGLALVGIGLYKL